MASVVILVFCLSMLDAWLEQGRGELTSQEQPPTNEEMDV